MPTSNENPSEQFAAVETLLSTWLQERNHVLAKYTHIAIFTESAWDGPALEEQQKDLCALLVDYISAGHFEVFHRLIAEAEAFADGTEKLAENLMPAIADTTEVILA
ncbi:MAG: regulator of sigma D, partial [Halioglobus sp.]